MDYAKFYKHAPSSSRAKASPCAMTAWSPPGGQGSDPKRVPYLDTAVHRASAADVQRPTMGLPRRWPAFRWLSPPPSPEPPACDCGATVLPPTLSGSGQTVSVGPKTLLIHRKPCQQSPADATSERVHI